ncbi:MAG TPA: hypothetical protein VKB19_06560, partial [Pedobacter sp.]|nr:hypothetical protein [Pedobacter sp.]
IVRVKRMVYQKNTALNSLEKGCLLVAVLLLCSFSVLRATSISQNTVKFQEPVPKKNKEQNKTSTVGKITGPKSGTQVTKSRKSTSEVPVHIQKDDSWKEQREIEASANGSSHETVNTNQNGNKNGTTNISINIDNKKIENFAVNIANTVTNAINLALDSSLKYTSNIDLSSDPHPAVNVKLNTQTKLNTRTKVNPQARLNVQATPISNVKLSPTPKVEVNTSGLTEILIGAMEKAGINTKGENLEFHVTNTQLIVNGKKQSEKILNAVLTDVIKSSKDTIDFTYTRTGNVISTSSIYNRN